MPKKSKGTAYDMCNKSSKTRLKHYRNKAVRKQRSQMCSPGYMPRCVKGRSYCARTPKKSNRARHAKALPPLRYLR